MLGPRGQQICWWATPSPSRFDVDRGNLTRASVCPRLKPQDIVDVVYIVDTSLSGHIVSRNGPNAVLIQLNTGILEFSNDGHGSK